MNASIVNLHGLELTDHVHGGGCEARPASIAAPLGAHRPGARPVVVPAGKKAWPFHRHHVNEAMFVILAGSGRLRLGEEAYPLRAGGVAVCPPGRARTAHQIVNDSDAELRCLAIRAMQERDVMQCADSGELGVFAGAALGGDAGARRLSLFVPRSAAVDHRDGEV